MKPIGSGRHMNKGLPNKGPELLTCKKKPTRSAVTNGHVQSRTGSLVCSGPKCCTSALRVVYSAAAKKDGETISNTSWIGRAAPFQGFLCRNKRPM